MVTNPVSPRLTSCHQTLSYITKPPRHPHITHIAHNTNISKTITTVKMSTQQIFDRLIQRNIHTFESIRHYIKLSAITREAINKDQHDIKTHNVLIKEEEQYENMIDSLFAELKNIYAAFSSLGGNYRYVGLDVFRAMCLRLHKEELVRAEQDVRRGKGDIEKELQENMARAQQLQHRLWLETEKNVVLTEMVTPLRRVNDNVPLLKRLNEALERSPPGSAEMGNRQGK